jgi:hypothetical protein
MMANRIGANPASSGEEDPRLKHGGIMQLGIGEMHLENDCEKRCEYRSERRVRRSRR